MDDLCTACLCTGRRLFFIGETGSYHLYSQIINEIPVYDLSDVSIRVCFECRALLRRFGEFKLLVKKSYTDLLTQLHQNCPPTKSSLARPSRLSIQNAATCSYPELFLPIKEEVEVDYGVPLEDVDSTSVKEECYPDHSEPEAEAFVEDVIVKKIKKKKTNKKTGKDKTKKKTKTTSKKLEEKKINTKKKAGDSHSVSSADKNPFLSDALAVTVLNDDGIDDEENVSLDVVRKEEQLKEKQEKALSINKRKKTDVETNGEDVQQVEKPPKKANGAIPKEKNPEPEMVGDKPKCGECGKIFSSKKTYRYHLNVLHKGQNRYPCPRCGKVYQWKSNLGRHLRTHKMTARQRTQAEQYIKRLEQNQNQELGKNKTKPIEYVNCSFASENPDDDDIGQENYNDSSSILKDVERKLKDTLESSKARNYETNTLKVTSATSISIAAQNIMKEINSGTVERQNCEDNLKEMNSDYVSYCNETILVLKQDYLTGENAEASENHSIEDNPSIKSENNSAIATKDANKDIHLQINDNNKNNTSYFYIPIEDGATNSPRGSKINIAEQNRAIMKIPANKNQEYINSAGKESKSNFKAFKANFDCKCAKKCTEILSVAERKAEYDRFWNIGSFEGRCAELQKCVQELHKKRCYSGSGSNRVYTRKYYLLNKEICKVAFLNTLRVSGSRVNKALVKKRNNETNDERINTISADQLNAMKNFISSFLNSSNYFTESGMANLPPHVKLSDVYDVYKTENRNKVSFSRFRKCFVNDFNWKSTSTMSEVQMRHIPLQEISETNELQKHVTNSDPILSKSKGRKSKSNNNNVESETSEIDNSGVGSIETLDLVSNTSFKDREMEDNYLLIVEDAKYENTKNKLKNVSTADDCSSSEKYNSEMFEMETVDDKSIDSDDEEVKNRLISMQTYDETNQVVHHIGANNDVVETETTHEVNKPVTSQHLKITSSTEKEDNFDKEAPPAGLMYCSKYEEILNKKYTTGRKRKVADQNPAIRKIRANTNQDYISITGKEIKSKPFNANFNCKCTKKCTEILPVAERKAEFDRFWNLGSFQGRCAELQRCVKEENKKRCYASLSKTKRIYTRKYVLLDKEVCKVAFLKTFGVSASRVNKALAKKRNNETNDKRGIEQGGKNAISTEKLNAMRNFISSLVNSSNYCTEDGMAYLPPNIKLPALYAMYKEQHDDVVCFSRFRRCFVNDFNLKLVSTLPKVDMPVDQINDYSQDELLNNSIDSNETDDETSKAVCYLKANYDAVDTETAQEIDNTVLSQSPPDTLSTVIENKFVRKAMLTDVTPIDGNNCEKRPKKGRPGRKRKIADQNQGITSYIQFLRNRKFII